MFADHEKIEKALEANGSAEVWAAWDSLVEGSTELVWETDMEYTIADYLHGKLLSPHAIKLENKPDLFGENVGPKRYTWKTRASHILDRAPELLYDWPEECTKDERFFQELARRFYAWTPKAEENGCLAIEWVKYQWETYGRYGFIAMHPAILMHAKPRTFDKSKYPTDMPQVFLDFADEIYKHHVNNNERGIWVMLLIDAALKVNTDSKASEKDKIDAAKRQLFVVAIALESDAMLNSHFKKAALKIVKNTLVSQDIRRTDEERTLFELLGVEDDIRKVLDHKLIDALHGRSDEQVEILLQYGARYIAHTEEYRVIHEKGEKEKEQNKPYMEDYASILRYGAIYTALSQSATRYIAAAIEIFFDTLELNTRLLSPDVYSNTSAILQCAITHGWNYTLTKRQAGDMVHYSFSLAAMTRHVVIDCIKEDAQAAMRQDNKESLKKDLHTAIEILCNNIKKAKYCRRTTTPIDIDVLKHLITILPSRILIDILITPPDLSDEALLKLSPIPGTILHEWAERAKNGQSNTWEYDFLGFAGLSNILDALIQERQGEAAIKDWGEYSIEKATPGELFILACMYNDDKEGYAKSRFKVKYRNDSEKEQERNLHYVCHDVILKDDKGLGAFKRALADNDLQTAYLCIYLGVDVNKAQLEIVDFYHKNMNAQEDTCALFEPDPTIKYRESDIDFVSTDAKSQDAADLLTAIVRYGKLNVEQQVSAFNYTTQEYNKLLLQGCCFIALGAATTFAAYKLFTYTSNIELKTVLGAAGMLGLASIVYTTYKLSEFSELSDVDLGTIMRHGGYRDKTITRLQSNEHHHH